jgi:hypothetical protein
VLQSRLLAELRESSAAGEEDEYTASLLKLCEEVLALLDQAEESEQTTATAGGIPSDGSGSESDPSTGGSRRGSRPRQPVEEEEEDLGRPPLQLGGRVEL